MYIKHNNIGRNLVYVVAMKFRRFIFDISIDSYAKLDVFINLNDAVCSNRPPIFEAVTTTTSLYT